jgi:RNA polymerase sigma factor (sigma-70 family)
LENRIVFLRALANGVFYNRAMLWEGIHALVSQSKAGDARAWEQIMALAQPHLVSVVLRVCDPAAPWQSVSDLLQDTWLRAWQGLADFRGGSNDAETGALLRSWLTRTLKRTHSNSRRYANAVRRKTSGLRSLNEPDTDDGRAPRTPEPAAREPGPGTVAGLGEAQRQVSEALARLDDPKDREIIRLCFFDDVSLKQVAEQLALPYHEVRQRYHRSLQRLADVLRGLE